MGVYLPVEIVREQRSHVSMWTLGIMTSPFRASEFFDR